MKYSSQDFCRHGLTPSFSRISQFPYFETHAMKWGFLELLKPNKARQCILNNLVLYFQKVHVAKVVTGDLGDLYLQQISGLEWCKEHLISYPHLLWPGGPVTCNREVWLSIPQQCSWVGGSWCYTAWEMCPSSFHPHPQVLRLPFEIKQNNSYKYL